MIILTFIAAITYCACVAVVMPFVFVFCLAYIIIDEIKGGKK